MEMRRLFWRVLLTRRRDAPIATSQRDASNQTNTKVTWQSPARAKTGDRNFNPFKTQESTKNTKNTKKEVFLYPYHAMSAEPKIQYVASLPSRDAMKRRTRQHHEWTKANRRNRELLNKPKSELTYVQLLQSGAITSMGPWEISYIKPPRSQYLTTSQ